MSQAETRDETTDWASWALIAAMLLAFFAASWGDPFRLDWARALLPVGGLFVLASAALVGWRRQMPRCTAAAIAFLQMTLFTITGVVLAYAMAARGGALWDGRLAAADRALGFHWPAIRTVVDRYSPAVWVLGLAYHSLIVQMVVAIVALGKAGRVHVLRVMVAAAILSGFVTILLSGLMPAMGNLFDPRHYRHLWPSIAWLETGLITGLRDGSRRVLDLSAMMGIVSFPSYHATLAVIFIWAFRQLPRFAVPGGVWAVLTILGTPIFGGHYGVDVIAGILLAPPSIALAHLLVRWSPRRRAVAAPARLAPAVRARRAPALDTARRTRPAWASQQAVRHPVEPPRPHRTVHSPEKLLIPADPNALARDDGSVLA